MNEETPRERTPREQQVQQTAARPDELFQDVGPSQAYRLARLLLDDLVTSHGDELLAAISRYQDRFPKRERGAMGNWLIERVQDA